MKIVAQLLILFLITFVLILQGCIKDDCTETYTYTYYEPVYTSILNIRNSISNQAPTDLENPGKIYITSPYLFVNEIGKGVHIFDNTDKSNPQNIAFIAIPGNVDIAVKNNILYADSYMDLVSIDISNPTNTTVVDREENVFLGYYSASPELGIVTDYTAKRISQTYACNQPPPIYNFYGEDAIQYTLETVNSVSNNLTQVGIGGSMSRFALLNNYLYTITNSVLSSFDVSNSNNPTKQADLNIPASAETIFPFKSNLLIGTTTGMLTYNLSNPSSPQYISSFTHATSCDPVVAQGNYAYVTLRSGNSCNNNTNELNVIDINDFYNPTLVKTYSMTNPHGLGIDNNLLFICDGSDGLKIYDATNPETIDQNKIAQYSNINTFDVIPYNKIAIMVGSSGIFQYDYSDSKNIKLLSSIIIKPK